MAHSNGVAVEGLMHGLLAELWARTGPHQVMGKFPASSNSRSCYHPRPRGEEPTPGTYHACW